MPRSDTKASLRFSRREFLKAFLPMAVVVAVATMGSAVLLSALYMRQSMRILEENEAERLQYSMRLFSRIHLGSVPAFLSVTEEQSIKDFLYGRDWSIEKPLRGLARIDRAIVENEFIDSFYLYNADRGVLSTRSGWEGLKAESDPDLGDFLDHIREYGLTRYVPRKVRFQGEAASKNLFTLVLGPMPAPGTRIHYAFIVNLSERALRSALTNDAASVARLYILDNQGRFLSHPDAARFGADSAGDPLFDRVRAMPESSGSTIAVGADGRKVLVWWVDHPELRWRFISVADRDALFAPVMRVRDAVVIISLLVLASAVAALFVLSAQREDRNRRDDLALAFLRGEMDSSELRLQGLLPSLRFPAALCALKVDDYAALVSEHGASALHEFRDLFMGALPAGGEGFEVLRGGDDWFLVLVGTDGEADEASLRAAMAAAASSLGAGLGGYFMSERRRADDLPQAFSRLRALLGADYLRPRGALLVLGPDEGAWPFRPAAEGAGPARGFEPAAFEKALRSSDAAEALRQADALVSQLRAAADGALFAYAVTALGSRIPALLGAEAETLLPGGAERYREDLSGSARLDDAERLLRAAAASLGERGALHAERRQRELVDKVKELIDSRLSDRALGTASIAAEVGLSASYLRDLFKKREGVALLDYLSRARLALAKRLLDETRDSVRSVCDQAGFINYSYFFTYFKKMTGCTPSEYREGDRPRE